MMQRRAIRCFGCGQPSVVRMGVDTTIGTRFYFPCPYEECGLPIRGTARSGAGAAFSVTFVDAEELDPRSLRNDAKTTTVNPFVPGHFDANSLDAFGGSSIFALDHLLGERLTDFMGQRAQAFEVIEELWPPVRRLYEFYLAENWERFERALASDFYDWNLPREPTVHARAVAASQPILAATWHVVEPGGTTRRLLETFAATHLEAVRVPAYRELLKSDGDEGYVRELQRGVFNTLERFTANYEMWAMGGLPRFMPNSRRFDLDRLTLARDELAYTGSLYQEAFERISKTLRYAVAAENSRLRGDPNAFGSDHPENIKTPDRPRTMRQFERIPNASKVAYAARNSGWADLPQILNNRVRNSIGHSSVRHDLRSGRVVSDKDPKGVNYVEFLAGVYELYDLLSIVLQVLRTVRIASSRDWPTSANNLE